MAEEKQPTQKLWTVYTGLILAAIAGLTPAAFGIATPICWTAAVTTLVASWWILEPVPIPVTSMLPFALFPLVGILDFKQVASSFGEHIVIFSMGGFIISTAMEKSGAHRRLALGMVHAVGGKGGRRIVLGFMLAVGFISLWISNIAAMLMVLPIAMAVIEESEEGHKLTVPLLLGLSYAASIGGIGTPIGTPTNLIFMAAYKHTTGNEVSFFDWMKIGMPIVILLIPLTWLVLTRKLGPAKKIDISYPGPWRTEEIRVLIVFALTALAWIFRKEPFGGWTGLIGRPGIDDSTVALLSVVTMFFIPNGSGGRLLDWKTANSIPWGLLLLLAGGITISKAFDSSGFSELIGRHLAGLSNLSLFAMMAVVTFGIMMLTEVTTNMAVTALSMPLLAATGTGMGIDPALLMIPAAISASCAFMLPCGTFPNAVICGTGKVSIKTMASEGAFVKLVAIVVVTITCYLILGK